MAKKKIETDAEQHNRNVLAAKKKEAEKKTRRKKHLAKYAKGLPSDKASLIAETKVMVQTGGQFLWEAGRRLIVLRSICDHGDWLPTLQEIGISAATAWRAMESVKRIPESELKRLGKTQAYDIMGAPTKADEEMVRKLENGELTEDDFLRESKTDVKKMAAKIAKLQEKVDANQQLVDEMREQINQLVLGTVDERAIRQRLAEWHAEFDKGIVLLGSLKKDVSEQSQLDIYSAIQWMSYRLLQAESLVASRFPQYDTYGGPDRAMLLEHLESQGRAGKQFQHTDSQPRNHAKDTK